MTRMKALFSALGVLAGAGLAGLTTAHAAAPGLPASIEKSGTLRICSAVNLPPMEFMNAETRPVGLDIDLGDAIASHLGVKPEWINMPFAGLIPALLASHCDVIMSQLFIKPGRLKVIDEIPYMISHEAVLVKRGKGAVPSLESLSGKKVATVTGTTATVLLKAANKELAGARKKPIDIVMFPENTQALQQLQFGQVAAYGVAYETARYYIHKAPGQFALGGPPYYKIATGIGIRKNEAALHKAVSSALADMMKNGSYAAIFRKWNLGIDMLKPG
ncbi:ABC transporter substrate-binding protein [Acidiphilium multivorum]|uniref:ABC transporter substrate-binding protein n=1 Tax=Acidiphilium multivorum TaxID=62140 RepID=UPI001F4C0159|nr:ABC transporter substrate-binding protein [Acidiphilium multivorum]UNC12812.1 ABC transporter substrate-binding protein [Acidiphilium multivorum]